MKSKKGFTLIELILYIALVTIFVSGAIQFAWDILYGRVKSRVQQEVNQNVRLVNNRITAEIQKTIGINSMETSSICLAMSDGLRNPTKIYLSDGRIRIGWGGGAIDCTGLTNDEPLTGNLVTVSSVQFIDLGIGNSTNIGISLTVESTADRKEWQYSQSTKTSVEVRTP